MSSAYQAYFHVNIGDTEISSGSSDSAEHASTGSKVPMRSSAQQINVAHQVARMLICLSDPLVDARPGSRTARVEICRRRRSVDRRVCQQQEAPVRYPGFSWCSTKWCSPPRQLVQRASKWATTGTSRPARTSTCLWRSPGWAAHVPGHLVDHL